MSVWLIVEPRVVLEHFRIADGNLMRRHLMSCDGCGRCVPDWGWYREIRDKANRNMWRERFWSPGSWRRWQDEQRSRRVMHVRVRREER